jgi:uracil phosphoribosyltransferase
MPSVDGIPQETPAVIPLDHSLAAAKLAVLRARTTPYPQFRAAMEELSMVLLAEAARTWGTVNIEVETPLKKSPAQILDRAVVLVPILRAGLGMVEGMLRLLPDAAVGHVGIYRDEETLRPVTYFSRLPPNLAGVQVLLVDPMLATGSSAVAAVSLLKQEGADRIQFVCVVSCPAGIRQLQTTHPDVEIITAAIDPELNDFGYIVPGLGDAGDRYFGTGPPV